MNNNKIVIKINNTSFIVKTDDIFFIEMKNRHACFHTQERIYEKRWSLKSIEEKLGDNFVRCHRSYIINLDNIYSIFPLFNSYIVNFKDYENTALISKGYFKKLKSKLEEREVLKEHAK